MDSSSCPKIKIGVSSCLLGQKVRFDSGHKKNSFITGALEQFFEYRPFCPEVEIGLGIPREPIRLVLSEGEVLCKGTKNEDLDVTSQLTNIAEKQLDWHSELCGYIVKKDSPSCGMSRVKVYSNGAPSRTGVGLYIQRLMSNFPSLPVEEEGRLMDAHLRENFIQRVYVYSRWKNMINRGLTVSALQDFHATHKYILMSHNQLSTKKLGTLLAGANADNLNLLSEQYLEKLMFTLKTMATRKNHVNTLQHIQGYLKKHIDADDKAELKTVIESYSQGLLPLIVPITLLRHHFRKQPNDYITQSYYMSPHPGELMLLNSI